MIRIFVIATLSLASFFPFYMLTTNGFGIDDNWGATVSGLLAILVLPSILLRIWRGKPSPDVIPVDKNDPIILELAEKSRHEITRLAQGLAEERKEGYVKFPYKFGDDIEHVWGIAHYIKEDYALVSLDSSLMGALPENALGRFKVKLDELEDWMLVDSDGKTYGGYSILGLAKVYTRDYGKLPKAYQRDLKRFVDFDWP